MNNISGTEAGSRCLGEGEQKKEIDVLEKQIQLREKISVSCFSHNRFPPLPFSKLLIAVETRTLRHPQSCNRRTGGPLRLQMWALQNHIERFADEMETEKSVS